MSLELERLGDGAAFLLQDEATGTTILLGCGEVKALNYASGCAGLSKRGADPESEEDGMVSDAKANASQYLADLKDITRRDGETPLTAMLITDSRPETCFLLPFITERTGIVSAQQPQLHFPIVMTHGTKALGPHLLVEYWSTLFSSKTKDKSAPYDMKDIAASFQRTNAIGLKATTTISEHLKITAYHAGHVAGGCVFNIEIGATTVLFINDFNLGGGRVLLPAQIPRLRPTAMITRSAFAVTVSDTRTAMERELMKVVRECVMAGGKVIIPVYKAGFLQEIQAILVDYWTRMEMMCPIYTSDDVMAFPSSFHALLRRSYTPAYDVARQTSTFSQATRRFDWKLLEEPGAFVLFTTPANIGQGDSCRAIKAAAADPKNLVVLSEYCKPGTINYSMYADPIRKVASKRLGVTVSCGVHYFPCGDEVDAKSIVELARHVRPQQVFLDYVVETDVAFMKTHVVAPLQADNATVSVQPISHNEPTTTIQPAYAIPLRIHKSMFNNPSHVQGVLIAEPKRKLVLVSTTNGVRRLKKKRHSLEFALSWKKPVERSHRVKKKSARAPSAALSFLLSGAAESADEDEPETQLQADADALDAAFDKSIRKWIQDMPLTCTNRRFQLQSVRVLLSCEWEVHLDWAYEDDELAGRVLGIAKQVIYAEFKKTMVSNNKDES